MFVVQMTASHLPYTRNGLKFFTRKGGLTSPEVEAICDKAARKYANRLTKVSTTLSIPPTKVDFMSTYAKHLRDIIKERVNHPLHYDTPLKGFQVPFYSFYSFAFSFSLVVVCSRVCAAITCKFLRTKMKVERYGSDLLSAHLLVHRIWLVNWI